MPMNIQEMQEITGSWDYGMLPPNVRVGEGCYLERKESFKRFRSARNPGLVLGRGVRVYTWTEFNVETTGLLEIGDESVLVGAVFMCAEHILIGQRVIISYNVTIADSDFHPRDPDLRKLDAVSNAPQGNREHRPVIATQPVRVEDEVWIGIGAILLKGVRIGKGARIGAGAVVTMDIPAGAEVAGNPGRLVERGNGPVSGGATG